jgi:hypothetical protein
MRLIALDPDDGSVAWEVPDVVPQCTQAVDSQGRIWVLRDDGSEPALEAIDADGNLIDGTRLEGVWRCFRTGLQIGGDTEHLLIYGLGNSVFPGVMAIDVSGDEPVEAWTIDLHADRSALRRAHPAPSRSHRRVVALPRGAHRAARRVDARRGRAHRPRRRQRQGPRALPVMSDDPDADGSRYSPVRLMKVDDDRLVAGVTRRSGGGNDVFGYLAAIDYAGAMTIAWQERTTGPDTLARLDTGPKRMALGDGVIITQPGGRNELVGFSVADGSEQWADTPVLGTGRVHLPAHHRRGRGHVRERPGPRARHPQRHRTHRS